MKIFIGTPCYNYKVYSNYVQTLVNFQKEGWDIEPFLLHDSLVTRARNTIITNFYENKENYTHLLWLDADTSFSAEGLSSMISKKVDVIGTPISLKYNPDGDPNDSKVYVNVDNVYEEVEPFLYKCDKIGAAALLMSKKSVVSLIENSDYYFIEGKKIYDVFKIYSKDEKYVTEDWHICGELISLGYEIYADCSMKSDHIGLINFPREISKPRKINKKEDTTKNISYF